MLQVDITARLRKTFGKSAARSLRRNGVTPAVLYGLKIDSLALELETKPLTKALLGTQRRNAVFNLDIDGDKKKAKRQVMLKELQLDPVMDTLVHADFYEISLDKPMTLKVHLKFVGKAKGVDLGGDLVVGMTDVLLKGKALDIPDDIEVDITSLDIGQGVTCKELPLPGGVTLQEEGDRVCVSIASAAAGGMDEASPEEAPAE